ncbi:MAG: hypothetical protein LUG85_04940 [Clostridiales bacterium]|nr:hypothetical protein [Clostridiales bacterium]
MASNSKSHESDFMSWLSAKVSPAQLSELYWCCKKIDSVFMKGGLLSKPLFETTDTETIKAVQKKIETSKIFRVRNSKNYAKIVAAVRYYLEYSEGISEETETADTQPEVDTQPENDTQPEVGEQADVTDNKPKSTEQETPVIKSLLDFLIANNISFVDNRPRGCFWMIGGKELTELAAKCSALGVTFHFKPDGIKATGHSPAWWTTDDVDIPLKSKQAEPAANTGSEDKPSPPEKSNRLKFMEWLCEHGVSSGDTFAVLSSLKRCADRLKTENLIDEDIYSITSAEKMKDIRSFLFEDKAFIIANRQTENRFANAINLYTEFFDERLSPPTAEAVTEPKTEDESAAEEAAPILSEVDELLSEEIFAPLKAALAKENIRTAEELKSLKLWAFMNRNNLYSISMRQTVLDKVRRLLEPPATENPDLLYELHCGETVYYGDTLAKSFLHFCEDIAKKYPLFFRSLLDKAIGGSSYVRIYRSPEDGNFIGMENPTCYVSADLEKESVIAAVEWIIRQCSSTPISVSVKEPDALLSQSAYEQTPQEELSESAPEKQSETAAPDFAAISDKSETDKPAEYHSDEQTLNFAEIDSLAYTKPTAFSYKGSAAVSCGSWSDLYAKLIRKIYRDYESLFYRNMRFAGSGIVDLGSQEGMMRPRIIASNVYLECNVSATGIVKKIRWVLNYCSINPEDVTITYRRRNNGNVRRTSRAESRADYTAPVRSASLQDSDSFNSEQIAKAEKIVLDADMNGVTYDSLQSTLGLTMVATKALVRRCKRIAEINDKLYHEDAFVDWDEGAKQMHIILEKLMQKNNGYVSAAQLYGYVRAEMNMFLNDNDMNNERSVYEIAQHLFEKNSFEGSRYSFSGKTHISKSEDAVSSDFDVICRFAEEQGGVFTEDDLSEYLTSLGIRTANLRNKMRLNKEPLFFFYEPGTIISVKSMKIDDSWKESVKRALDNLLNDADGHIILRRIRSVWYDSLPALPGHRQWTPLLLQFVLRFYGEELGAKTIMAMESQNMETIHAMLVKADSQIQSFGDAVIACLTESETDQRSFEAEELRQLLVRADMLHGNELIWNMPKALAKDERFAWDANGENVTVRV